MRLLCFLEEFPQFFWAALHEISYINIAADLMHQSTASFRNQAWIRATVMLGDVQITLTENPGHNIHLFFSHVQCPGDKIMTEIG